MSKTQKLENFFIEVEAKLSFQCPACGESQKFELHDYSRGDSFQQETEVFTCDECDTSFDVDIDVDARADIAYTLFSEDLPEPAPNQLDLFSGKTFSEMQEAA